MQKQLDTDLQHLRSHLSRITEIAQIALRSVAADPTTNPPHLINTLHALLDYTLHAITLAKMNNRYRLLLARTIPHTPDPPPYRHTPPNTTPASLLG